MVIWWSGVGSCWLIFEEGSLRSAIYSLTSTRPMFGGTAWAAWTACWLTWWSSCISFEFVWLCASVRIKNVLLRKFGKVVLSIVEGGMWKWAGFWNDVTIDSSLEKAMSSDSVPKYGLTIWNQNSGDNWRSMLEVVEGEMDHTKLKCVGEQRMTNPPLSFRTLILWSTHCPSDLEVWYWCYCDLYQSTTAMNWQCYSSDRDLSISLLTHHQQRSWMATAGCCQETSVTLSISQGLWQPCPEKTQARVQLLDCLSLLNH